jgi:3-methylcrotonyl-CoA carboxylase alpha subunit
MSKITLRDAVGGEPVVVELQRAGDASAPTFIAVVGSERAEVEIHSVGEGAGWMRTHGKVRPFYTHRLANAVQVWLDGRTYDLEIVENTPRRAGRSAAASGAMEDLKAPMPGTILNVNVTEGDTFNAHAPLIVMESMKMEMTLSAPAKGRVKEVMCRVGQLVELGTLLAKLEAADDD